MILDSSPYVVHASAADNEGRPASVSVGQNVTIRPHVFVGCSLYMTPDDARALAYDLLKAADHADGLEPQEVSP